MNGKWKKWVQSNFKLHIADQPIRAPASGKFYRYLGAHVVSAHSAEGPSVLLARLIKGLECLQRCPAKPQEKIWMLVQVLLPQLLYPMLNF